VQSCPFASSAQGYGFQILNFGLEVRQGVVIAWKIEWKESSEKGGMDSQCPFLSLYGLQAAVARRLSQSAYFPVCLSFFAFFPLAFFALAFFYLAGG
jgi:hypothetical protein